MIHTPARLTSEQVTEKTLDTLKRTLTGYNWRDKTATWITRHTLGVWQYCINGTLDYQGGIIALKEGDHLVAIDIINAKIACCTDSGKYKYTCPLPIDIWEKLDTCLEGLYYGQRDEIYK